MSEPQIIYENGDFLVVNKPAGLVVHGMKTSDKRQATRDREENEGTLVDWLLEKYPEIKTVGDDPAQRPGIVHRLDKDTSGVMLVARNQASFEYLKSLFQKHEIVKTYRAVVLGIPEKKTGTINAPIGILTGSTRRSVRSTKMAKEAVTEYKVVKTMNDDDDDDHDYEDDHDHDHDAESHGHHHGALTSLLEVRPKTGRTHQIRVHLASIGHPIVGDPLYGTKISRAAAPRLMLHAFSVEFTARDGKRVRFEAETPENLFGT